MKKKLIVLSILVSALCLYSCNKVEPVVIEEPVTEKTEPEETTPSSWFYVLNGQQENGFNLWIFVRLTDEGTSARVVSGTGGINKDPFTADGFAGCDLESLTYNDIENGFTLSDPDTGEVRYTVNLLLDNPLDPIFIYYRAKWTHSPGTVWDENAQEKGWQSEMNLYRANAQVD